MPRIYKGEPWEVKYRKDVRSIGRINSFRNKDLLKLLN